MAMTLQGRAKVRRVGNGLCVPIPTKEARAEGIKEGTEVDFIVLRPQKRDPTVFGSARHLLKGRTFDEFMAEPL